MDQGPDEHYAVSVAQGHRYQQLQAHLQQRRGVQQLTSADVIIYKQIQESCWWEDDWKDWVCIVACVCVSI